jgi:hypothetical protein
MEIAQNAYTCFRWEYTEQSQLTSLTLKRVSQMRKHPAKALGARFVVSRTISSSVEPVEYSVVRLERLLRHRVDRRFITPGLLLPHESASSQI